MAISLRAQIEQHRRSMDDLQMQYDEISDNLKKEKESSVIQNASIDILKTIIDRMSEEHIERIVDLLTYALQTIFFDRAYTVEIQVGDKRNSKVAELVLVEEKDGTKIRSPFDGGIGGGVLAVVGFILQVYYLGYLNQASIMFCDESFSQVSAQYVPTLMGFIKELAEQEGFIFVLISHDERLNAYADRQYLIDAGEASLVEGYSNEAV